MRILYVSDVDWNWIKQRPQFLAEALAQKNKVEVIYQYKYGQRHQFQSNKVETNGNLNVLPMHVIPRLDRYNHLRRINDILRKKIMSKIINKFKPDWIYLTHPVQVDMIPKNYHGKIIYDCMDDHILLEQQPRLIEKKEKKLINRATVITVTSNRLRQILKSRYKLTNISNIYLVRNGFNGPILKVKSSNYTNKRSHKIAYFGSISTWFDFNLLESSLKKFDNLEYFLIGPVDDKLRIPTNKRIHFLGTVEHGKLYNTIKDMDALIMPFIVNDVIKAVDPVKIYEYINFDKNIITVKYGELKHFSPYVFFYEDKTSFMKAIENVISLNDKTSYSPESRMKFLADNSWNERAQEIEDILLK